MMKVGQLRDLVKQAMIEYESTRDDDMKLFYCVCYYLRKNEVDFKRLNFVDAMWYHKRYAFPSYDTVSRIRRKLQEQHPELRGEKYAKRQQMQDEYRDEFRR